MSTTSDPKDRRGEHEEEKDKFHDDNWPIGFDNPNVVGYLLRRPSMGISASRRVFLFRR